MSTLGGCGKSKRNLLLSTKKLDEGDDEKNYEVKGYDATDMDITRRHLG